jgi:hypothetical protein
MRRLIATNPNRYKDLSRKEYTPGDKAKFFGMKMNRSETKVLSTRYWVQIKSCKPLDHDWYEIEYIEL